MPRKQKPESLKLLAGDPIRKPKTIELTEGTVPEPMRCLSADERADWDRLVEQLRPLGCLAAADSMSLTLLVKTLSRGRLAQNDIDQHGVFDTDARGRKVRSPAVSVLEVCERESRMMLAAMGLTVAGRKSLDLKLARREAKSQLQKFIGG